VPAPLVFEIVLVLLLIVLNGVLAMSELAIVSSRRSRLEAMAQAGKRGAQTALQLAASPGHFLSAVQIGITLVGLLTGIFSGTAIAEPVALRLEALGVPDRYSDFLAFTGVVVIVTFISLVVGELVPKRLALRNPEAMAVLAAPIMALLTRVAWPLVVVLEGTSRGVLTVFGPGTRAGARVTREEIKALIAEGESAGIVAPQARAMMSGVMRLAERRVSEIMTRRDEVDWVDLDADDAAIRGSLQASAHSRLPAAKGSLDALLGVIRTKDVLDAYLGGAPADPRAFIKEAPVIIDAMTAVQAMELLRKSGTHMVLVVDEYGVFQGLLTTSNILEAIAGAFPAHGAESVPTGTQRDDQSWLLDGELAIDQMAEMLGIHLPAAREYSTVAGMVLTHLMQIPHVGESFVFRGWRFEVVDMDGRRIDKVLASRTVPRRIAAA